MITIYKIIQELKSTLSRKEKEAILTREIHNDLLKRVFVMTYDPNINFWIKKIPGYQFTTTTSTLSGALDSIEKLADRTYTGNAAAEYLSNLLSGMNEDDSEVLKLIIARDLDCGVNTSTINKIWKNLIPETPYMRCSLVKHVNLDTWNWKDGIISQLKADGSYATATKVGGDVIFSTRAGTIYPSGSLGGIESDIRNFEKTDFVIQGELVIYKNGELLPREIGNGILNSIAQGGSCELDEVVKYLVWDILPYENFKQGLCKTKYISRLQLLRDTIKNTVNVDIIETREVFSYEEAISHYEELISKGFEGTIIKIKEGIWKDHTSKEQIKLKVDCCVEVRVKGFNEGNGKNKALFGSLQCESEDGLFKVNVSGFKDKERLDISNNRDYYLNRVLTICINNIMKPTDSNKFYSAFLPRSVEFRTDKTVADTLQQILDQYDSVIRSTK